jgi:transposase
MIKRERKSYDKAFKLIAVELYRTCSPAGTVAKELGIGVDMVRRWAREHSEAGNRSFPGNGKQDLTQNRRRSRR